MESFKVKGYAKIRKQAPKFYQVKGKVSLSAGISESQIQLVSCNRGFNNLGNFRGPSLRQRLFGYAVAGTLVTVAADDTIFVGRVISVDGDDFEVIVVDPLNSHFVRGSLATVNIHRVSAIASGGF